jgi:hypothetical protein
LLRFVLHAVPLVVLFLAAFGFAVDSLHVGELAQLTLLSAKTAPVRIVFSTWLLEAFGLVALFLLIEGKSGLWWLDGLLTGWVAWIFRGPLLVVTIVVEVGRAQNPWWKLALGWWWLYTLCGLALAILYRRQMSRSKPDENRNE